MKQKLHETTAAYLVDGITEPSNGLTLYSLRFHLHRQLKGAEDFQNLIKPLPYSGEYRASKWKIIS